MKQFKSVYKNYHHLNPLYTPYEYCNSNTATHHSHNVQKTSSTDQTFHYSRGTCIWPTRSFGQRVRLTTTLFNVDLWLSGATHLLPFMPTWCAAVLPSYTQNGCKGRPRCRMATRKEFITELLHWQQMVTVNMVQQLMFRIACTEQTVSQHLVFCTGNGAYCYIYVSTHMNKIT